MKLNLLCLLSFFGLSVFSQDLKQQVGEQCGTPSPSQQWDEWFNKEVEKYKQGLQSGKTKMINYTIPMVVHVIHWGEAVGTYPNLSQAQINSQLSILNADMAGTGLNVGNVPAPFAGLVANTGIQFCFATTDPTGSLMPQPGIDRINGSTMGWTNPATLNNPPTAIVNLFNDVIKPATIWDPTKYFNVWVSAKSADPGILGFGLFPTGTALTGIPGGTANVGGATTDGVWCYAKCFGNTGTVYAPDYDKGRTMTHEVGHWLGLRHMWGDGNCLTDFCNDTPWAKGPNSACPVAPYHVNLCGAGLSPNGEMTMDFMDYTYQACMYMFTPDQAARMQTAMSQGTYRNQLGTHGLCTGVPTGTGPAVAAFAMTGSVCIGGAFTPSNTSTGGPAPTYTWNVVPLVSFTPNANVAQPAISFPGPGSYTITLTASNSLATSSYSMVVLPQVACPKPPVCLDTLRGIKKVDTLTTYIAPTNSFVLGCQSGFTGFLTGTNCYKDKEFAQFYPSTSYSDTPMPQVNSLIVLFDKRGTKATPTTSATQIYFKIWGGTGSSGPGSMLGQIGDSLGAIEATTPTNQVQYCGKPTYIFPSAYIIPNIVDFAQPIIIPTSGFFASVQTPFSSLQDSIKIFSDTKTNLNNDSSAWVLLNNNNWRTLRYQRNAKVQLAIMPQISCRPVVGIQERTTFQSNINLMPNPSSGLISLVFTLPKSEKINMRIFDYVGQELSTDQFENVSKNVFDIDLSSRPDGVYFIEISNGNEKITKKIIISH